MPPYGPKPGLLSMAERTAHLRKLLLIAALSLARKNL
jgi:hypothetical protein